MPDLFGFDDGVRPDATARGGLTRSAEISPCGLYRYALGRSWDDALPPVTFVMLNPSKADAEQDDPTITRCLGFARSWGCGALRVVNLFAYRATDPRELRAATDPVGPDNDATVLRLTGSGLTLAAWGAHPFARQRIDQVRKLLELSGARLHCLRLTKDGHPWHPLYVPRDVKPVPFEVS